jgi:hypothetical protein
VTALLQAEIQELKDRLVMTPLAPLDVEAQIQDQKVSILVTTHSLQNFAMYNAYFSQNLVTHLTTERVIQVSELLIGEICFSKLGLELVLCRTHSKLHLTARKSW